MGEASVRLSSPAPVYRFRVVHLVAASLGLLAASMCHGWWMTAAVTRDLWLKGTLEGRAGPEPRTVLVTVGDLDLALYSAREPQFIDRRVYARAIDRLMDHGARAVVFDMLFDRKTPHDEEADRVFVRSVRRSGRVILATCFAQNTGTGALTLLGPIPDLAKAAAGLGYVNVSADLDGVVRRVKLVGEFQGRLVRHLSMETALLFLGAAPPDFVDMGLSIELPPARETRFVPTGSDGTSIVNYAAVPEIPRVSLRELLERQSHEAVHRMLFSGKVVIVGAVSPFLKDRHCFLRNWVTGNRSLEDGAWFIAVFCENVTQGDFLREWSEIPRWAPFLGFAGLAVVFATQPFLIGLGALLFPVAGLFVLSLALFTRNILFDASGLALAITGLFAIQSVGRVLSERWRYLILSRQLAEDVRLIREQMDPSRTFRVARRDTSSDAQEKATGPPHLDTGFVARYLPDRYTDLSVIGMGGMGVVYKALDRERGRQIALKVLSPLLQDDREFEARFLAEARTLQRLSHPALVHVFDVGRGVLPFFCMELVEGTPLPKFLVERKPLPLPRTFEIAIRLGGVLAHIHALGLVHRDVKPSNVMILPGDEIKLLDFGLAQWEDATRVTQTGVVMGTFVYMSPEQFAGKKASGASDVYSWALVTCEMLTGETPARVGVAHELPSEPLARRCVPSPIAHLLGECLNSDPEARPAASSVLCRLEEAASPSRHSTGQAARGKEPTEGTTRSE